MCSAPRISRQPASCTCARFLGDRRVCATRRARFACSTSRASVDLPLPETPVTTHKARQRQAQLLMFEVVQIGAEDFQRRRLRVHRARRMQRVPERMLEEMPRHRFGVAPSGPRPSPAPPRARRGCPRPVRGRARAPRGVWCPRRARPPPAYCPWPAASPACRAARGCRAGAGRWWARRGCSTRRAGSSRAAPRGGCAAPRRRRAWARSAPARDSRARLRPGNDRRDFNSATRSRAISASRPLVSSSRKNVPSCATGSATSSAIERLR